VGREFHSGFGSYISLDDRQPNHAPVKGAATGRIEVAAGFTPARWGENFIRDLVRTFPLMIGNPTTRL
jgi:hypothetical protein